MKLISGVILGPSGLAFGANHFLEANKALSYIKIKDITTITVATGFLWRSD